MSKSESFHSTRVNWLPTYVCNTGEGMDARITNSPTLTASGADDHVTHRLGDAERMPFDDDLTSSNRVHGRRSRIGDQESHAAKATNDMDSVNYDL